MRALFFSLYGLVCLSSLSIWASPEEMFPPAPEAKSTIDFDGKGFTINGERAYLASGSMHYPRVPQELWHDRLLRLKRGGFDVVQTYAFWNYHEAVEGKFDFSGPRDFERYLTEAQKVGLYATVRVGPYVCAEWDSGGYPIWLKWKPDLIVRKDNPAYVAAQDAWLKVIIGKVVPHQINKGGNVILVQLENEGKIQGAWTTPSSGDKYFDHLRQDGIDDGLQIPFFMSGYHHGSVAFPEDPIDENRQCPWISTEIWAGWYTGYGYAADNYGFLRAITCNDKIMARGGDGQNYYMLEGGTNFDTWNDNEDAASYDYSAAMSETGQPRPQYFGEKENNLFATSFASILGNAVDAKANYQDFASNARLIGARKSPAGTVLFLRGLVKNAGPAVLQGVNGAKGGKINIPALRVAHIVLDAPLVPDGSIKIIEGVTNILGLAHNGDTTTVITFGDPGETGELALDIGGTKKQLELDYSATMPAERTEMSGNKTVRVLSMSRQLAEHTWIAGEKGKEYVVVGPEYLGDFEVKGGQPSMNIERQYGHVAPNQVMVYGPAGSPAQHLQVASNPSVDDQPAPVLGDWQVSTPAESATDFNDASWKASDDPEEMGKDGDISAFGWYRATVNIPQAGSGTLHFPGAADNIEVFVDGKRIDAKLEGTMPERHSDALRDGKLSWTATGDFIAGKNSIAVFTSHMGRDKAGGYWGQIQHYYPKGIFAPVSLDLGGKTVPVQGWKLHGGVPDPATLSYQPLQEVKSPAFFRTTFNATRPATGANPILRLDTGTLSRGTAWINGHCVGRYPPTVMDHKKPIGLWLPECWFAADGKNTLVLLDEEGMTPAGVKLYVQKEESREVIAVSQPAPADTAFQLPSYEPIDLRKSGQPNAATDQPATASSSAPKHDASLIDDSDDMTIWQPATSPTAENPAWIQIDLQQPHDVKSLEIFWSENPGLHPFEVTGSADGQTWRSLLKKEVGRTPRNSTFEKLPDAKGIRYVRLTVGPGKDEPYRKFGVSEIRVWDIDHNG